MGDDERGAEDHILIQRFLAGDVGAFERLVERYYQRIDHLAQQVVRHPMAAEDIAQEVFLRAYRALPRFRGEASLYSWLYRIAINLCLNYLRRQANRISTANEPDISAFPSPADPSSLLESQERERLVRRAIGALPSHYRIAIILRDLEGLSYHEIADILGIPLGTVKSRINSGKRLLRQTLRPILDDDAW
jgi:RNA polymerase sigma-70 factor (ECF subfamily)